MWLDISSGLAVLIITYMAMDWSDFHNHKPKNLILIMLFLFVSGAIINGAITQSNEKKLAKKDASTSNSKADSRHISDSISLNSLKDSASVLHKAIIDKDTTISKLQKQLKDIKGSVSDIKEYVYISTLNNIGQPTVGGQASGGRGDLSNKMCKILLLNENAIDLNTENKSLLSNIDEVIEKYPKFPYIYMAKAVLLEEKHDKDWRKYAAHAVAIFKITTKIQGHYQLQDGFLASLEKKLNESTGE